MVLRELSRRSFSTFSRCTQSAASHTIFSRTISCQSRSNVCLPNLHSSKRTSPSTLLSQLPSRTSRLRRDQSTLSIVKPSKEAEREVPTPLLFISASKWTGSRHAKELYAAFLEYLSRKGWESIVIDLDLSSEALERSKDDSQKLMNEFENELKSSLSKGSSGPFPPVLISQGLASLISQTYSSSNPLSALVLLDPPISNYRARTSKIHQSSSSSSAELPILPTELSEFDFEPRFPIRIGWNRDFLKRMLDEDSIPWYELHRIETELEEESDESLERWVIGNGLDEQGFGKWDEKSAKELENWLEEEVGLSTAVETTSEIDFLSDEDPIEEQDEEFYDDQDERISSPESSFPSEENASSESSNPKPSTESLPPWFLEGAYKFSRSKSKKLPLELDERDLSESFVRGSGAGGQAINKLSTSVQLVHLPTGTRIVCQETRSREQNRLIARRRMSRELEEILRPGKSVKSSKIDKERKKKRNREKKNRKKKLEREREGDRKAEDEIFDK